MFTKLQKQFNGEQSLLKNDNETIGRDNNIPREGRKGGRERGKRNKPGSVPPITHKVNSKWIIDRYVKLQNL